MAVFEVEPELGDDSTLKARTDSDCSLTEADIKRNVGITEGFPGEPPAMALVRRTRVRIRYWGKASEKNRSVTIVPREPRQFR
jgi:hypothetical protein